MEDRWAPQTGIPQTEHLNSVTSLFCGLLGRSRFSSRSDFHIAVIRNTGEFESLALRRPARPRTGAQSKGHHGQGAQAAKNPICTSLAPRFPTPGAHQRFQVAVRRNDFKSQRCNCELRGGHFKFVARTRAHVSARKHSLWHGSARAGSVELLLCIPIPGSRNYQPVYTCVTTDPDISDRFARFRPQVL